MSEAFALAAHAALARAGAAFFDAWDAELTLGVSAPVECKVFIDRNTETMGEFGEVVVAQTVITFVSGAFVPAAGATVVANAISYVLERKVDGDGVTERWSARRG